MPTLKEHIKGVFDTDINTISLQGRINLIRESETDPCIEQIEIIKEISEITKFTITRVIAGRVKISITPTPTRNEIDIVMRGMLEIAIEKYVRNTKSAVCDLIAAVPEFEQENEPSQLKKCSNEEAVAKYLESQIVDTPEFGTRLKKLLRQSQKNIITSFFQEMLKAIYEGFSEGLSDGINDGRK